MFLEAKRHLKTIEGIDVMTRVVSLILLLASSCAFAQLSEPHAVRDTVIGCVNVRDNPVSTASLEACLGAGALVTVVDEVPFWREITFDSNGRGWIAKKFIVPVPVPPISTSSTIPADAFLEVHFVDVGQGDAIWIQTHDDGVDGNGRFEGKSILIDGGPYSADDENPLREYVESIGHHGAVVEALIVTHPHTDHYRGAETISRHFDIEHYYDPGFPSTAVGYNAFLNAMRGTGGQAARANQAHIGEANFGVLDWGSELSAEFLYAWPGSNQGLGSGNTAVNNSSIVLRLEYGDHVFLFMGDAEGKDRHDPADPPQYVEQILLNSHLSDIDATVLKIGHHGSETSSTTDFIAAVDPEVLVVQSGRKPFSGTFIPDSTTLQRYCDHNSNIRIYRTDQGDAAAGLLHREAVDNDHVVIRTNGTGAVDVEALEGGNPIQVVSCNP